MEEITSIYLKIGFKSIFKVLQTHVHGKMPIPLNAMDR